MNNPSPYRPSALPPAHICGWLFSMEGENAAKAGNLLWQNPYRDGSQEYTFWANGWLKGFGERHYSDYAPAHEA
jgi:hypothetical protein